MAGQRWTTLALAALALGVISIPWSGHLDDVDAQLYQVVTRHMVEDGAWLDLRALPGYLPVFREHVPFGFWPWAAGARLFGEWALGPISGAFTLATLLLVLRLGRALGGDAVAAPAVLVLIATDSFLLIGGRSRLDPLLYLFTTASVLPVLASAPSARRWAFGAAFAALGALVKGPFGLLPFAAAATAVSLEQRSWRWLFSGAGLTAAAALPEAGFLAFQRLAGDATWWTLHVEGQLFASAFGARPTGHFPAWYPFSVVATRFWPGLPLLALGAWPVLRGRATPAHARLFYTSLLVLLALGLPGRKVWNHALIAFPLLALLAGLGVAPWIDAWSKRKPAWPRRARLGLSVLGAAALAASLAGLGRWLHPPCIVSGALAPQLSRLAPRERVGVVAGDDAFAMLSSLAAETTLLPEPATGPTWPLDAGPRALLVLEGAGLALPPPAPWRLVGQSHGWALCVRPPR